jgi:uncharacterized membrane protein YcfT
MPIPPTFDDRVNGTATKERLKRRTMQNAATATSARPRVDWVDYAKGFCIIFVVMMHSTLGVELAAGREGWMHYLVAFAKPFRMPDFFMISGLFLAASIERNWRTYLDRKVVHFAYFYALWVTIQFAFKAPGIAAEHGAVAAVLMYFESFIEPFGTLWFIYLLPIFFVVTKLARPLSPAIIWGFAAALEILPIHTGWTVIDEFAARFVYFYSGYIFAPYIFKTAKNVQASPLVGVVALIAWGIVNGFAVFSGYADLPFVSLALGLIGAGAVIHIAVLLSRVAVFAPLRYCGEHSIVIYLAFFLPMAASRTLLLKTGLIADIGTVALLVTASGVIGSLLLFWALRPTPLAFLYERPQRFWLEPKPAKPAPALQPAE